MPLIQEKPTPPLEILLTRKSKGVEEMKSSFEIASLLRQKGYVIEIDFGQRAESDYRWIASLEKVRKTFLFSLTDRKSGKEQKRLSFDQLLQELEEARCH